MALAVLHISHIQSPLYKMIAVTQPVCASSVNCVSMAAGSSWRKQADADCSRFSCVQAVKGSQQQTASQKPLKLAAESTTGLIAVEGEVPIMMPAKLATNKARVCL